MQLRESTLKNTQKISLIFFSITGLIHLSSSILISNQLYLKEANIIQQISDLPMIIIGLMYAYSSLRLNLTDSNKNHKIIDTIAIIFVSLIAIAVILINFLIPDF